MKLTALRFARLVDEVLGEPLRAAGFAPEPATCTRERSARQVWRSGERFVEVSASPQMLMDPPRVDLTLGTGGTAPPFLDREAVGLAVLTMRSDAARLPDADLETVRSEFVRLRAELLDVGADFLRGDLGAFRPRIREAWAAWMAMREARGAP